MIPTTSTCNEQAEGDNSDVVFLLQDGVMLSNVITGPSNGEGESKSLTSLKYRINTLMNCKCALSALARSTTSSRPMSEDTATFKQTSGTSYVNGGGARNADDKVLQRNGGGTVEEN